MSLLAVSKSLPTAFLLVSDRHFFRQRSDHPRPTLAAKSTTGTAINEVGRIVTVSPALEVAADDVVELDVGNGTFHIDDDSGLAGRDRVVDRRENRRAVALDDDDSITIYLGVERVASAPVRRGFLHQHIHHAI